MVFSKCAVVSNILGIFTPFLGEMIQFDLRIFFKLGWFNHQVAIVVELLVDFF